MTPRRGPALAALRLALPAVLLTIACSGGTRGRFTEEVYRGREGSLSYRLFVPARPAEPAPLVVILHGCSHGADEAAEYTRMNERAARRGLLVLYPEQDTERNVHRCWNWFRPAHQRRGRGEPALLAGAVEQVVRKHSVDRDRIFAAGLSAGAGMSAVLGACYPDVFAAIGLHSGAGYQGGLDQATAMAALGGPETDPDRQGRSIHLCAGGEARVLPVIAIHGDADRVVAPSNAEHAIHQFAQANDLADDGEDNDSITSTEAEIEDVAPPGRLAYRVRRTRVAGRALLEHVEVRGLGHLWSGTGSARRGPDATRLLLDFFASHPRSDARR